METCKIMVSCKNELLERLMSRTWPWVEKFWDPILVGIGELTRFRTYFSGWIGMFTGTIWILSHGQRALEDPNL